MQAILVTAEGIGVGVAALVAIGATVRYVMRAELSTFRVEMREWVNGSFMRSKEVAATLKGFATRLEHIETNGCARRAEHE